jgi:hypothetical protein
MARKELPLLQFTPLHCRNAQHRCSVVLKPLIPELPEYIGISRQRVNLFNGQRIRNFNADKTHVYERFLGVDYSS